MPKLDGTEKIIHTPYDAHEQVVRKSHTHSAERGYEPKAEEPEPKAEESEPKAEESGRPRQTRKPKEVEREEE